MFKYFSKKLIAVFTKIFELFELFIREKDLHKAKILISCEVLDSLVPDIIWEKDDSGKGVDRTNGLMVSSSVTITEERNFVASSKFSW